jgi:HEAT repeat protein
MPFKPGQSGNPGGRPKQATHVRDLARAQTERAILALIEALDDPKAKVAAAQALLDRGWGKAATIVAGDPDGAPVQTRITVEYVDTPPTD